MTLEILSWGMGGRVTELVNSYFNHESSLHTYTQTHVHTHKTNDCVSDQDEELVKCTRGEAHL